MNPAPRPTSAKTMTPAMRYGVRFGVGMAFYPVGLTLALILRSNGVDHWWPMLFTLPAVGIITWAVVAYYREADEFEQRKLGESFVLAFGLGVPTLLVLGLLEAFGGPQVSTIIAFVVMMASWLLGSLVANRRYR